MRVLTAIVTHNRCALLSRCLDYVERQHCETNEVIVVDNGSTDSTRKMLSMRGIPYLAQENVGAAGGWHRAISYALARNFEAVWLMDDDGFPDENALSRLIPLLSADVACVSSVVLKENARNEFVFPMPVLDSSGMPVLFARKRKLKTIGDLSLEKSGRLYPFIHLFNGALINLKFAHAIGNVDQRFFIFGEELDYLYRLRRAGRVMSSLDSLHFHPDVSARPYSLEKIYYYLKNSVILHNRYYRFSTLRNILLIPVVLFRTGKRNGIPDAASFLFGRNSRILLRAISRGLRGHLGADFDG